jgi:hypothetical protein
MSTESKTNKGRFSKGASGNPSGRPRGSPNKARLLMEALLEGEAQELIRKVIDLAKDGDTQALRLCLDRLMPAARDRAVVFDFPPIQSLEDIPLAMTSIMTAISEGRITPPEGELLSHILADYARIITTQDVERRLQKLEEKGHPPHEEDLTVVQ